MRQGKVYVKDKPAGIITEDERGYSRLSSRVFGSSSKPTPVSLTLPLRAEHYHIMYFFFLRWSYSRRLDAEYC